MRNKIFAFATAAALISAAACGCGSSGSPAPAAQEAEESTESVATEEAAETLATQEATETPILEESTAEETPATQEPAASSDSGAPVEGGVYEVDGIQVVYYPDVLNDVTGNWRLGVISDGSDLNTYVVDYFKYFYRSDVEVHGIVNLGLGTTTRISKISGDTLKITVMEYVDGEEHDAKLLYSGDVLGQYLINMDTLEVEPLE